MKCLVASDTGRGFVVPAAELLAEKRTGKQVLNLKPNEEAAYAVRARRMAKFYALALQGNRWAG